MFVNSLLQDYEVKCKQKKHNCYISVQLLDIYNLLLLGVRSSYRFAVKFRHFPCLQMQLEWWVWWLVGCRYNLMLQCWHDSPGLRPAFSDLVSDLDRILAHCVSEVETDNSTVHTVYAHMMIKFVISSVTQFKLESSHRPQTSANAMLFARWQHHIWFGSGFPYAPLKAMLTKISKWSRIWDSFQITPKIESLVVFAIPDISQKIQKDPSITFWVILLTHRQTNKVWQQHNLLGGGN